MCGPEVAAIATVVSAVAGVVQGQKQQDQMKKASEQQARAADATLKQGEREQNRLNARSPDTQAIIDSNQRAAKDGGSSTMLTGAQGIDPSLLTLGKNTLLGGV